ncbi:MAG: hypothetical protein LUC89_02165 [Oscillospiraceae bacterium]|nr:hypothetical protein [Oscillospiraceae bacterium]
MKKYQKLLCAALSLLMVLALSACSDKAASDSAAITLDEEDEALLEAFGDDLNVVAPEDFASFAASLDASYEGQVYQVTGYYVAATSEDEEVDLLCDSTGEDTSSIIQLRYLTNELTSGSQYTITGIVALEQHGDHTHVVLDVVTVESYTES